MDGERTDGGSVSQKKGKVDASRGGNMIKHRDHSNLSSFAYGSGVLNVSLLLTTHISGSLSYCQIFLLFLNGFYVFLCLTY